MNEQSVWMSGFAIDITPWELIGLTSALMFGDVMTLSYFISSAKQDAVGVLQKLFLFPSQDQVSTPAVAALPLRPLKEPRFGGAFSFSG